MMTAYLCESLSGQKKRPSSEFKMSRYSAVRRKEGGTQWALSGRSRNLQWTILLWQGRSMWVAYSVTLPLTQKRLSVACTANDRTYRTSLTAVLREHCLALKIVDKNSFKSVSESPGLHKSKYERKQLYNSINIPVYLTIYSSDDYKCNSRFRDYILHIYVRNAE